MLKLNPSPTFVWPIKFKSPEGEQTLTAVFKHMSRTEYDEYLETSRKVAEAYNAALDAHALAVTAAEAKGEPKPEEPKPSKTQKDEVLEILVGWQDVDQPFSKENFEAMLANYWDLTINSIWAAFAEGLTQRKLGN